MDKQAGLRPLESKSCMHQIVKGSRIRDMFGYLHNLDIGVSGNKPQGTGSK